MDEVRAKAEQLHLFVGTDWRQQAALSTVDAEQLVSGQARTNFDHQNAWLAYQDSLQRWQGEREKIRRDTWDEVWKTHVRAGSNNGPATDKAHAAAREAVAQYDKANPVPVFNEPQDSGLKGLIWRVRAGTR